MMATITTREVAMDHGPPELDPRERVLASGRALALLGETLREGADARRGEALGMLGAVDLRELAAAHFAILERGVFAHESVWLGDDVLVGGPLVDRVRATFDRLGVAPPRDRLGTSPDHVGAELAALAFVTLAEADALADGADEAAERMRALQRDVLDHHLLRWMPGWVAAVQAAAGDDPAAAWWRACVELAAEVVADRRWALGEPAEPPPLPGAPAPSLADEATDLRAVVDYLVTPSRSGWFLDPATLTALGRRESLPRGFGGRRETLTRLLRSAGQYFAVPAVVAGLIEHAEATDARLAAASLAPWAGPWRARLADTRRWLRELHDRAPRATADASP